jgi:PAS domain S-box-containing protein
MSVTRDQWLGAATLALLGVAVYLAVDLYHSGHTEVVRQFKTLQTLLAQQSSHEVESYLQECSRDLRNLARLPSIQRRSRPEMESDFQAYYKTAEHLRPLSLRVVDREGTVLLSSRGGAPAPNYANSEFLEWAWKKENRGKVFVSSWAHMAKEKSDPPSKCGLLLATPLYRGDTGSTAGTSARVFTGVLLMTMDLEPILTEHLSSLGGKSSSQRVWIMDQDGTVLLQSEHPEMTRQNIHRPQAQCAQCHESFDYAKAMLATKAGVTQYQLKGQPRKLAAFAPMQFANASWTVVVNAPYAAVTAFSQRSYSQMLLLLGIIAVAVGLASIVVHRNNLSRVQAEAQARQWQDKLRLEGQIRRAEERYRTLFEQSPDGILMLDPQSTLPIEFNEAAHRQLGYSREEFARLPIRDYEAGDQPEAGQVRLARILREGRASFETCHRHKSGELRTVEVIAQSLELVDRKVLHCIYHDVTERKRAALALERRTVQLEALHQVGLSITAQVEPEPLLETITAQAVQLFQGTAGALFLHRPAQDELELVVNSGHDPSVAGRSVKKGEGLAGRVWASGAPLVVEDYQSWEGRNGSGETSSCAATMGAPIRRGETFVGVMEICSDRRAFFSREDATLLELFATQAAIAIKNAGLLEQVRQDAGIKTTLLNDVNHRVKNNLMRLGELVRLERDHAPDSEPGLKAVLGDLESRLHGMTVVHTMLSSVQWGPLSLSDLVTQIVTATLSSSPLRQKVRLAVQAPPETLWIVPEQATAVALIVNELATNSVKHAFCGRAEGSVTVRLQVEPTANRRTQVRLEYRDDGPGWPEAVLRGERKRVGLHLIQASVRSPLRGDLTLRNDNGAVAELNFKLASPE